MDKYERNWTANKIAIMECSEGEIVKCLNYRELESIKTSMYDFLSKTINEKHICVGLDMTHNIYIPSVVLCLEQFKFAFMFLGNRFKDNVEGLNINWVLSFKETVRNCSLIDTITLKYGDKIHLHKTVNSSSPIINYSNTLYAIKTSGTTGDSKLVRVEPNCIHDNINSLSAIFKVQYEDVIYFGTPLTFDPSIVELFLALKSGASLLIPAGNVNKLNPSDLFKTLFPVEGQGVTILQIIPSVFHLWSNREVMQIVSKSRLRILAFGEFLISMASLKYLVGPLFMKS